MSSTADTIPGANLATGRAPNHAAMSVCVAQWLSRCVRNEDGCLVWPGAKSDRGYALVGVKQPDGTRRNRKLHRIAYEALVGPIPAGMDLDHVRARGCRSRACCNVAHLEPVPHRENVLRGDSPMAVNATKTHCPSGHEYTEENTKMYNGSRYCRACKRDRDQAARVAA